MSTFGLENGSAVDHESDSNHSVGVAVLILGVDTSDPKFSIHQPPMIWAIKERMTKSATDKRMGQFSIPAETRKIGEQAPQTTLAALAEFTNDDRDIDKLYVGGYLSKGISVRGNPADVVVMIYDGPLDQAHAPIDPDETEPHGWVNPDYIKKLNGEVRPLAHDVLSLVSNQDMFALIASHTDPEQRIPLRNSVGEDFSLINFNTDRDLIPDNPLS